MTDLASLVVRMQADNSQYVKALEQSTAKLEKFAKEQETALSQIKEQLVDIGSKIAGAFTIEKIVEFSAEALESAASLEKLSQTSGISVESLGALRLAAAASGLSQEDLGTSLKKLNVNLAEAAGNADSKAGVAFKALGISVTDSSHKVRDAAAILPEIADKFAKMADGPNKVAFAVELMGKQGQAMIPVLNGGAAGLADFAAQAKAAGFASEETAAQAEEFEKKANVLKATLIDGLGSQLTAKLVPALNALIEAFNGSDHGAGALEGTADVLATSFKLLATALEASAYQVNAVGKSIGAAAAMAVAYAKGDYTEAFNIMNLRIMDWLDETDKATTLATNMWGDMPKPPPPPEKPKDEGPNLALAQAKAEAIKKLKEESAALVVEAQSYGLGKAALIDYKLQYGPLADAMKLAGDEGKKWVASIRESAAALQTKIDDKLITSATDKLREQIATYGQSSLAAEKLKDSSGELGAALDRMADHGAAARAQLESLAKQDILLKDADAIKAIDRETLTMTGHLKEAAAAAFDFQNATLIKNVHETGSAEDIAKIDQQRALAVAQGEFNEQVAAATAIETKLKTLEDDIELARSKGHITDLDAEAQLQTARAASIVQLQAIQQNEAGIADRIKDPALVEKANAFAASIKGIQKQTDQLEESVRNNLEQSFANNFEKLIDGSESFKKAVMGMLKDLDKMFLDMIAKNYAQKLFDTGGAGGGLAGIISGIMGGGGGSSPVIPGVIQNGGTGGGIGNIVGSFAEGGTIPLGSFGLVGEEGPELAYSGSQNLNIAPISSAAPKPITVHNQFMIDAPGGTISRQSQMQTAAAAARSLQQASRRNNS